MSDKIAIIFDFDDTLVPDSTTLLFKEYGIDTDKLWSKEYTSLISQGYDSSLGYLNLLLDNIGEDKPLGLLTNKKLIEFGESLDKKFYPGIPEMLVELKGIVNDSDPDISLEFYIISGGLQDIISGSKIVQENFTDWYGCLLDESGDPPRITKIKRAINFTEKTRYIFELNKGIPHKEALINPFLVNQKVPKDKRRIPFKNMVYVGDGLSDIPCFSLLSLNGGISFGIFDKNDERKTRKAVVEFLDTNRVASCHSPNYSENSDLKFLLRGKVSTLCNEIIINKRSVYN